MDIIDSKLIEDRIYKIGEISQATGLQKTANGWVKPKTGKAPGAKTGPGESKTTKSKPAESKTEASTGPKFKTEIENQRYTEGKTGWDKISEEKLPEIKKNVEAKIEYYKKYNPYAMIGKRTGLNAAQKKAVEQNKAQARENLAFYTGQLEGINKRLGGSSTDAASKCLTGDCKIRVKKTK